MGYYEPSWDAEGNPEVGVWVKEEPDCYPCRDSGHVLVHATGRPDYTDPYDGTPMCTTTCPDCNPSFEQATAQMAAAAQRAAEFAELVAVGQASWDEPPF